MVVKWSDTKYFFPFPAFLRSDLDDDRDEFEPKWCTRDQKHDKRISHHCHDRECRTEWEWADISHDKFRGFDVPPEKSYKRATNNEAESSQYRKTLIVADKCVECVVKEKKSSGKSVESIGDIHTICHRRDDQDEERDVEDTEWDISEKWYSDISISELEVEPVGSQSREEKKEYEFYSRRKSLCSPDFSDIEIVIHESYGSYSKECEECEVGFFSVQEWVVQIESELFRECLQKYR